MNKRIGDIVDDETLISSLAIGDSKAIRYMYKLIYPTVEKMVFKMNGSTQEAYDVFQDAMTIVYEKAKNDQLIISCKLSTYVTAVAKHLWLRQLANRKKGPISIPFDQDDQQIPVKELGDQFWEREAHLSKLTHSFEQLGEPCNSLLKSFYVHNKSMADIATEFGYTNTDNAKTQKYKCLNRLRKIFFADQETKLNNERIF